MPPYSIEEATVLAYTPFGTSTADAIVVTCLYFLFLCAAVANFLYTKYPWYDVLIVSLAFRTAAFGVRAAYTVSYKPALGGTFLAFSNAGFGANIAAVSLVALSWLQSIGDWYYGKWMKRFYMFYSLLMVASVITFGPICGVIAAGLEYGDYRTRAASYGERLRVAATYGLLSAVVGVFILVCCLLVRVFVTHRQHMRRVPATQTTPERRPQLLALLIPCLIFLALRGTTGALAIYPSKERFWVEDYLYYSLDTLPEFLTALILCWPTLMARIGQGYPRATDPEKAKKVAKGELSPNDLRTDQNESSHGRADADAPEVLKQQDQMALDDQV
ncbi:hypothetical protein WJX84_003122 [Apatococcus fuscideae]|uniref:Uncharacterized protein n=1 Tax=Apatococcus fuscideae TaxID=2026836 RepID=A0AAW1RNE7_9CHLO